MTPANARAAAIKQTLEFACAPDPAVRDETPKPDNERSAQICCGDSRSVQAAGRIGVRPSAAQNPARDNGNNATTPEQTIDGEETLIRDPHTNSFDLSEDKRGFYPVAVSRGAIQGGGGGFPS